MKINYQLWVKYLSGVVLLVSVLVLFGWIFNINILKSFALGGGSMKANTAICFLLSGIILSGLTRKNNKLSVCLSLAVASISLLTLVEYLFGINLGIDQLLFKDNTYLNATSSPGRMAPVTALNFLIIGICFMNIERQFVGQQVLMSFVFVLSMFSLYGHALNLHSFANEVISRYTVISIPAALCFMLLVLGYYFKSTTVGFSRLFFAHTAGAILMKRLLIPVFFVFPALFYLRLAGEKAGLYDTLYGINLMIVTSVTFIFLLILFVAQKLNEMEVDLRSSEADLRTMFENGAAGFALIDNSFEIRECNDLFLSYAQNAWGKKLGRGDNILAFMPDSRKPFFIENYKKIMRGELVNYETSYSSTNGEITFFNLNFSPVIDDEKNTIGCCIRCEIITDRKKAEAQRELLASIINFTEDAIFTKTTDGIITSWNNGATTIFGYTAEEIIGKSTDILIPPPLQEMERRTFNKVLLGETIKSYRTERVRKDGKILNVSLTISALKDTTGNITGASKIIRDITERVVAEKKIIQSEIQIRNFAARLNNVIEEERQHFAREIHDELGQQIVGLKIGLSSLRRTNEAEIERVKEMIKDVERLIHSIREIATELRPGILDTLGLATALAWLVQQFEKKSGIKASFVSDIELEKFEKSTSICFFRICQEALTNVTKHAAATEVKVELYEEGNVLVLKVTDNGKGISDERQKNPFSMGLLGMRERANIIGGEIQINGRENKGTTVCLKAKLAKN